MKYSIIIPTYNHFQDCLKPCLDSLIKNTTLDNIEIIVVANGCNDETESYVKSLGEPFKLLSFEKPLGYTKSINEGLEKSKGDFIVLLNNDTVFFDWNKKDLWLEQLVNPFSNQNCGITGPLEIYSQDADCKFLVFFCVMISRNIYNKCGNLDEIFSPGSGEDIDYCMKIRNLGFDIIKVDYFPIYHAAEQTVKDLLDWDKIYKRNMNIIQKRYNQKLKLSNNYERAVIGKNDIIPPRETVRYEWAVENVYGNKILEIGCSSGYSLRFLKDIKNLDYLGIDYDKDIIEYAKENFGDISNTKFQQADINTFELEKYDTIIAFEVIEHLQNGIEIVQKLKQYCKRLLISVPYNEIPGVWGQHHVLHNLTENHFPNFNHYCIDSLGNFRKDIIDENGLSLMLMKWSDNSLQKLKVGVITPVHNNEFHIDIAIKSVMNQTYSGLINHYIYNDGSSDKSKEIIKKYDHVILVDSKEKNGQSNARNLLIQKSLEDECEYIAFLDSDDEWNENHLVESIKNLEDYDIVYGKPEWHDGEKLVIPYGIPIPKKFIGKQLEHNNFIWISGVVLKSKCVENNKFDNSLNGLEDWDLWFKLFKQNYKFIDRQITTFKYLVKDDGEASVSYLKIQLLQNKHKFNLSEIKLNIACGQDYQENYINADLYEIQNGKKIKLDATFDVKEIPYEDNSIDEIRALHIIEHFDIFESQRILAEWFRVLKPTGKLILETPDFLTTCRTFVESEENFRTLLYGHFFAFPWLPGQTHKFLFTENQLKSHLSSVGFKSFRRIDPISNYVMPNTIDLFLTVEVYKDERTLQIIYDTNPEITCVISTKDRYDSTLSHTLLAICNQTYKPKYLLIYDDGEHKDLQKDPLYSHIFSLLNFYKIYWYVIYSENKGQVKNHIKSIEDSKTEWIWRVDDDEVPENNVLEKLIKNIRPDVGAIGGLVITSTEIKNQSNIASNKIEDIYLGLNEQWYLHNDKLPKEVDHLYSSFLYRKSIAEYCDKLSSVGHREETILTYEIKRKGYKIILDPSAKTWHFRNPVGGLRSHEGYQNYVNDEKVFANKMINWGIKTNQYSYVVLDNGIGDHYAFKYWLPEYLKINHDKKKIFFVCYPEVFENVPDIKISSIAEARSLVNLDDYSVYKWMIDKKYEDKLMFAYNDLYKIHGKVKEKTIKQNDNNIIIISPYSFKPDHAKSYPYWNELVLILKNSGFKVIQIGRKDEIQLDNVNDFLKDLPLVEIEKLILNCKFWIACDNFLQHLVNSLDFIIPGIVIWGVSNPKLFGYEYNQNILKSEKFLRNDQFNTWTEVKQNKEVFDNAEIVMNKIIKGEIYERK